MSRNASGRASWQRVVLSVICVILALILALMIFIAVYMNRMLGRIDRIGEEETLSSSELEELLKPEQTRGEDYTGPVYNEQDVTISTQPAQVIESENTINILLIGSDRRSSSSRGLSDAMILCTINKKTKTLTMTSFLRDTYVSIPGYRENKLNAAYPIGGVELLDATLKHNFGVEVDGNIVVDFSQFRQIIDLLGGVEITLTSAEAHHINFNTGSALTAGTHRLNGDEALIYSRIRKIDSDFGRTNRQRTVLTALINQFRGASLSQLSSTVDGLLDLISTDMTDGEILGYVMDLAPLLADLKVVTQTIPVVGSYSFGDVPSRDVVDAIFIDFDINRQALRESILNN